MDDAAPTWGFQLRKVLRYSRLYGPRRTLAKVHARRHMRRRFERLPAIGSPHHGQTVGIIGCGNYAFSTIAYFLNRRYGRVIGGCMDVDIHRAASLGRYYRAPLFTDDAADLIESDEIRLLYIASNHASHADYAIAALERGKDVYIEKPHVVDEDQLQRLAWAMEQSSARVYLGFNRPTSRLGMIARAALDQEPGNGTYNWFVAGHQLPPDHWYLNPGEGGRVLGNLCHWTDFLLSLVGETPFPIRIVPTARIGLEKGSDPFSDHNLAVSYVFGDGSLGTITFSEKQEPFEGVREKFAGQKGRVLIALDDFQSLTIERGADKRRYRPLFRDHGHAANICRAYENATHRLAYDRREEFGRILNTAWLFLKTKQAVDEGREIVIDAYDSTSPIESPVRTAA